MPKIQKRKLEEAVESSDNSETEDDEIVEPTRKLKKVSKKNKKIGKFDKNKNDEENSREIEEKYYDQTWKLFKGKYVLVFHLCRDCQDETYNSKDKCKRQGNYVNVNFRLCPECLKNNIWATNSLAPYKKEE